MAMVAHRAQRVGGPRAGSPFRGRNSWTVGRSASQREKVDRYPDYAMVRMQFGLAPKWGRVSPVVVRLLVTVLAVRRGARERRRKVGAWNASTPSGTAGRGVTPKTLDGERSGAGLDVANGPGDREHCGRAGCAGQG